MKKRCSWCELDELYIKYHDEEWGVPVHDDRKLFEMLILEGAQAGLSWITVLKKRENYRKILDNFDPRIVSQYDSKKVDKLLNYEGIIKNRLKINSVIKNAKTFLEIQSEFGSFDKYIWNFVQSKTLKNSFSRLEDIPARTDLSDKISKDLKKRGMSFVGSTIIYAYMQAIGIVNDHTIDCFRYNQV